MEQNRRTGKVTSLSKSTVVNVLNGIMLSQPDRTVGNLLMGHFMHLIHSGITFTMHRDDESRTFLVMLILSKAAEIERCFLNYTAEVRSWELFDGPSHPINLSGIAFIRLRPLGLINEDH